VKLKILAEAELESAEAAVWYEDREEGLGEEFLLEVADAIDKIRNNPQIFSRLESYGGVHEVRRCVLKRFPYLIVFACRPDVTLVIAIAHVRRRPLYWLERLT
jgi:hypothetical protein